MKPFKLLFISYWHNKKYLISLVVSTFLLQYAGFLYKSQVQNMLNNLDKSYYDIVFFGAIFIVSISFYAFLNSLIKIISDRMSLQISLYCANSAVTSLRQKNYSFFLKQHKNITTYIYDLMNITNIPKYISNTFNIFASIFGGLIFLVIKINFIIGLFILSWFIVTLYFAIKYQRKLIQSTKGFSSARSKFSSHISESYQNSFTMITSANYKKDNAFFESQIKSLYNKINDQTTAKRNIEIVLFIGIISLFVGFLILAFFLKQSLLNVGDLTMAVTQSIEIFLSFINFFRSTGDLAEEYAKSNRSIENIISDTGADDAEIRSDFAIDKIEFKDVKIGELEDFNWTIKKGDRTSLTKMKYKTSLILSLLKIHKVDGGDILINDINIQNINQQNIISNIAIVNQNIEIFNDTIAKNICLNYKVSTDELERIIKVVDLEAFVGAQNDKHNEVITNNIEELVKLKIGIARALVKDSPIFVFDTTFSRLPKGFFSKRLSGILKDKTIILVEGNLSEVKY